MLILFFGAFYVIYVKISLNVTIPLNLSFVSLAASDMKMFLCYSYSSPQIFGYFWLLPYKATSTTVPRTPNIPLHSCSAKGALFSFLSWGRDRRVKIPCKKLYFGPETKYKIPAMYWALAHRLMHVINCQHCLDKVIGGIQRVLLTKFCIWPTK